MSHPGVTPLHFCEKGVKTGAPFYQEDVLHGVVKPLNTTVFNGQKWVFQQKSTPAHKARRLRSGCGQRSGIYQPRGLALGKTSTSWTINCGLFWRTWIAKSGTTTWRDLKRSLVKAAAEIPLEKVRSAIAQWPESLKACVEAEGGHFEWHYYK